MDDDNCEIGKHHWSRYWDSCNCGCHTSKCKCGACQTPAHVRLEQVQITERRRVREIAEKALDVSWEGS
jgi:hypothetical protein